MKLELGVPINVSKKMQLRGQLRRGVSWEIRKRMKTYYNLLSSHLSSFTPLSQGGGGGGTAVRTFESGRINFNLRQKD